MLDPMYLFRPLEETLVKRTLALAAATTLLAGVLAGCGGDDGGGSGGDASAYCDQLKDAKAAFTALDDQDFSKFEDAVSTVHKLAGEAPDDVKDDWAVLDDTLNKLEAALADAGVKLSDLPALQNGELPEGVDMDKLMALGQEMQDLGGDKAEAAADAIEKNAKSECNIDLSED